jgi:hypothetical protein
MDIELNFFNRNTTKRLSSNFSFQYQNDEWVQVSVGWCGSYIFPLTCPTERSSHIRDSGWISEFGFRFKCSDPKSAAAGFLALCAGHIRTSPCPSKAFYPYQGVALHPQFLLDGLWTWPPTASSWREGISLITVTVSRSPRSGHCGAWCPLPSSLKALMMWWTWGSSQSQWCMPCAEDISTIQSSVVFFNFISFHNSLVEESWSLKTKKTENRILK